MNAVPTEGPRGDEPQASFRSPPQRPFMAAFGPPRAMRSVNRSPRAGLGGGFNRLQQYVKGLLHAVIGARFIGSFLEPPRVTAIQSILLRLDQRGAHYPAESPVTGTILG